MDKKMVLILLALLLIASSASAGKICSVYFTKIGCPVCSQTDPVLLGEWIANQENAVIIEYVFTLWYEPNAVVMGEYNLSYATGGGVPLLIRDATTKWSGIPAFYTAEEIYAHADKFFEGLTENNCLLLDGSIPFEELNLNDLPEKPKLWAGNRLLVKETNGSVSSQFLKELLFSENLRETLTNTDYEMREIEAEPAPYSGGGIPFEQAIAIEDSWVLKLRQKIELPENIEPLQNGGNGGNGNGGNGGNENADYGLPISIAAIFICLIAIIVFIKVKGK